MPGVSTRRPAQQCSLWKRAGYRARHGHFRCGWLHALLTKKNNLLPKFTWNIHDRCIGDPYRTLVDHCQVQCHSSDPNNARVTFALVSRTATLPQTRCLLQRPFDFQGLFPRFWTAFPFQLIFPHQWLPLQRPPREINSFSRLTQRCFSSSAHVFATPDVTHFHRPRLSLFQAFPLTLLVVEARTDIVVSKVPTLPHP